MAEVKPRGELLDRGRCAKLFGVSRSTIDDWVLRGMPVHRRSPRPGIPVQIDSAAAIEWRAATATTDAGPDDDAVRRERARLLGAQAALAELELAHRRGELVSVAEVAKADEHVMLILRDRLLAIPNACAAAAVEAAHRGGEREVAAVVRREIVGAMADLSAATMAEP